MIKPLLRTLSLAGACMLAAPVASAAPPSTAGLASAALAQPIFFKAISEPSWGKTYTYYGLAEKLVLSSDNEQKLTSLPPDYAPVFIFSVVGGKPYYLNDLKSIDYPTQRHAVLSLKTGEQVRVESNGGVFLPYLACPPDQATYFQKCPRTHLAGRLLDGEKGTSLADTLLDFAGRRFTSIELLEGPEAVLAFKTAEASFDSQRKAEQARRAAAEQAAKAWQVGLKEGSMTNCGMVIERKKEIANIQMTNGSRWLRIDGLGQPGTPGSCK